MKNLLLPRYRPLLRELLARKPLFAFDYDGTLVPIVDRPERVRMRARTRELVSRLARCYSVALISGRSRDDVLARSRGMGVRWWIGNHGSDPGRRDPRESRWQNDVANWRSCLTAELRIEDGFEVEDKGHSLSVHYRRASDPAAAELQVRRSAAKLPRCRRVGGKFVVNLVPDSAPDKGTALLDLMRESRSRVAFFIGDDVTDEDAFRARRRHPGVIGIRIGHSQDTDARFAIPDQRSIDRLLELILELV